MRPRKNRVMLVGTTTSGKTTLCQRIAKDDMSYRKTQTVNVVGGFLLDTPGEFLEKVHRHSYLLVCSYEVDVYDALCRLEAEGIAVRVSGIGVPVERDVAFREFVELVEMCQHKFIGFFLFCGGSDALGEGGGGKKRQKYD